MRGGHPAPYVSLEGGVAHFDHNLQVLSMTLDPFGTSIPAQSDALIRVEMGNEVHVGVPQSFNRTNPYEPTVGQTIVELPTLIPTAAPTKPPKFNGIKHEKLKRPDHCPCTDTCTATSLDMLVVKDGRCDDGGASKMKDSQWHSADNMDSLMSDAILCALGTDCTDCGPRCPVNSSAFDGIAKDAPPADNRASLGNVTTYTSGGEMVETQMLGVQQMLHSEDYYTCFAAEPIYFNIAVAVFAFGLMWSTVLISIRRVIEVKNQKFVRYPLDISNW
jgi:hypothetical protein